MTLWIDTGFALAEDIGLEKLTFILIAGGGCASPEDQTTTLEEAVGSSSHCRQCPSGILN